jgi:phosphoribosylanthranilate isomerase
MTAKPAPALIPKTNGAEAAEPTIEYGPITRVKICGITTWDDALLSIDLGASALGFNFYPASPRAISPANAWDIIRRLPPFVETVGVFVNWPPLVVEALARALHLDTVQLHGAESPTEVVELATTHRVIKAVQVRPGFRASSLAKYRGADAFLLDGFARGLHGGTGKTVDWKAARSARHYGRIILAGGLKPENVVEAIRVAEPYAVDVASGVESRPGRKDPARMRALFAAIETTRRAA